MKCPYCISDIHDEALVCAVCRRDLYIVRPLLDRIINLEQQLAALPEKIHQENTAEIQLEDECALEDELADVKQRSIPLAIGWLLSPLLALAFLHWLLLFVYDTPVVYLRILALLIPLPFGFLFARALRQRFIWNLLPAFLMATLSVFSMGLITSLIDHVPVWPQNMVETREFIEFAASIGFSFTTGLWLCHWQRKHSANQRRSILRKKLGKISAVNSQKLTEKITQLNDLGSGVVALATTALSIYTGLKAIVG
jgi:cation transport ATPase